MNITVESEKSDFVAVKYLSDGTFQWGVDYPPAVGFYNYGYGNDLNPTGTELVVTGLKFKKPTLTSPSMYARMATLRYVGLG